MCLAPVLFTKWNSCILHSKQGQNQDPAFSHMLFIGQEIVPVYTFVGQFCLFANLQIFTSFIGICFCQKSTWLTSCLPFHFQLYAICFRMRTNTKYLVQKFLLWMKAQYCYVETSRLSARLFVPWDQILLITSFSNTPIISKLCRTQYVFHYIQTIQPIWYAFAIY